MRLGTLGPISIAFAGLAAACAGCAQDDDEVSERQEAPGTCEATATQLLDEPVGGRLQPLVQDCVADASQCAPLCLYVARTQWPGGDYTLDQIVHCTVHHEATHHVVFVSYTWPGDC
jgi:hypothetical protein